MIFEILGRVLRVESGNIRTRSAPARYYPTSSCGVQRGHHRQASTTTNYWKFTFAWTRFSRSVNFREAHGLHPPTLYTYIEKLLIYGFDQILFKSKFTFFPQGYELLCSRPHY